MTVRTFRQALAEEAGAELGRALVGVPLLLLAGGALLALTAWGERRREEVLTELAKVYREASEQFRRDLQTALPPIPAQRTRRGRLRG